MPTAVGDKFEGKVVYDNCTQRRPEVIGFTITAIQIRPAYPSFPFVRANIEIAKDTHDTEVEVSLPTVGYYRYASHKLILLPPEDDGLALVCDFDGHDHDRCVGHIKKVISLETCAEFIFFREKEEEENGENGDDDHDNHDDHDKHNGKHNGKNGKKH